MKIPEKLKRAIGPFDITIKQVDGLMTDRNHFGEWHPRLSEIWQEKSLDSQQRIENFWHEIVEAINDSFGLGITHEQIFALGMSIAQVIVSLEEANSQEIKA